MGNKKQPKIVVAPQEVGIELAAGLIKHGKAKVSGVGIFETKRVMARLGRDPQSGDIIKIPSYTKIKFRPTKKLKEKVCDEK